MDFRSLKRVQKLTFSIMKIVKFNIILAWLWMKLYKMKKKNV